MKVWDEQDLEYCRIASLTNLRVAERVLLSVFHPDIDARAAMEEVNRCIEKLAREDERDEDEMNPR